MRCLSGKYSKQSTRHKLKISNPPYHLASTIGRILIPQHPLHNQFSVIEGKGYDIPEFRLIAEIISGGIPAKQRPEFSRLLEKLEANDTLVVAKIDRLGRDNIDVQKTILDLAYKGIKVISLDLPTSDLTSSEGKLMLQMFTAFAEFEKNCIRERTMDGLAQAKKDSKKLGRPVASVQKKKANGLSQSQVAESLGISIPTVKHQGEGELWLSFQDQKIHTQQL